MSPGSPRFSVQPPPPERRPAKKSASNSSPGRKRSAPTPQKLDSLKVDDAREAEQEVMRTEAAVAAITAITAVDETSRSIEAATAGMLPPLDRYVDEINDGKVDVSEERPKPTFAEKPLTVEEVRTDPQRVAKAFRQASKLRIKNYHEPRFRELEKETSQRTAETHEVLANNQKEQAAKLEAIKMGAADTDIEGGD